MSPRLACVTSHGSSWESVAGVFGADARGAVSRTLVFITQVSNPQCPCLLLQEAGEADQRHAARGFRKRRQVLPRGLQQLTNDPARLVERIIFLEQLDEPREIA